ncbi:MAG: mannitol dehydrogenase family protein [Kineosporiaceae bacterium]|nr:mannitol dehydrogenase family protein [Aeromicrobium sp.]
MSHIPSAARLSLGRAERGRLAPVRIVHIGLGAFHRAHEAWYTQNAVDGADWGIAAFTGRTAEVARQLEPQGGLYTLVERGDESDRFETISTIVRVAPASDLVSFIDLLSHPEVAIVSLTITEAGYRIDEAGGPDLGDRVVSDDLVQLQKTIRGGRNLADAKVTTPLARLLLGLEARRRVAAPPLAILPCDNFPNNGRMVRRALEGLAELVEPQLATWLSTGITVISTSVDRITPRTTEADRQAVLAATGQWDESPVVCEPFSDWVLSGEFPAGRPAWETAGARFVADIEPWERRKLWMLNGAHTALAIFGLLRGHSVVSESIADPACREMVRRLWAEDARHLRGVEVDDYAAQLLSRFGNPRMEHRLDQIATDTTTKLRLRIVPVAFLERDEGRSGEACAAVLGTWTIAVALGVLPPPVGMSAGSSVAELITGLDAGLGNDSEFRETVEAAVSDLRSC